MEKKILYPNDVVYYQQHKIQYNIVIRPLPYRERPAAQPAAPLPPHSPIDDLTDKDGLDQAYSTYAALSTINHTLYISSTKVNRTSDIYYITKSQKHVMQFRK